MVNKRIITACLFLFLVLPSVHAFGTYSNNVLSSGETEKNLTFTASNLSQLLHITIPKNTNITNATWILTGYPNKDVNFDSSLAVRYEHGNCPNIFNATGHLFPASHDGSFSTDWQYGCDNSTTGNYFLLYYENISFISAGVRNPRFQIKTLKGFGQGSDFIRVWNSSSEWDLLLTKDSTDPLNMTIDLTSEHISDTGLVRFNITLEFVKKDSGVQSLFEIKLIGDIYPENITIDTGNDGHIDYTFSGVMNETNSPVTADLNETAFNDFLRNEMLCPGDFATANCDVPLNVSSSTPGILEISNISILGEFIFGVFNVSILDEMTGDEFDIAGSDSVVLSFFCANETQNVTITSQGQEVNVLCVIDEVRITVTEAADEIIRYLVPITNQGDLNFYVYNSTEETDVTQNWLYFDVTGLYENGIVVVTKVIFDLGERTMIEKIIDSESKTTLFLVVGEKYCFSVFDSNRANERDLGCMDADTDAEKRISISTIPFAPDQAIAYEDVFVAFSWDKDAEIIQGLYNDTLDLTNIVTFTIYNATNSSHILFTSSSTSSVVTFTYNGVDVNGTYVARIVANHQRYGIIDPMVTIDFGGKYQVAGLEALGLGIWMSIAGGMISMLVMLAFGKRYAKIGSAVFVFMLLMFMQWGWFDSSPQIGWLMLTFIAFIVFGNVMTLKRRLQ